MGLHRFWFMFDIRSADWSWPSSVLRAGLGCTGWSREDCENLIREKVLQGGGGPPIRSVIEDVDVSTLDPRHVLPNMGSPLRRGIWFPRGFE